MSFPAALPPLNDPKRNIWMRGKLPEGRCLCGTMTYNLMVCWDSVLRRVTSCWDCCPVGGRPDPRHFPRFRRQENT